MKVSHHFSPRERIQARYPHIELLPTLAGHIERSDQKKVIIGPKNIEFGGVELAVR